MAKLKTYMIMVHSTKKIKRPRKGFYVKAANLYLAKVKAELKLKTMGKKYGKLTVLPTLDRREERKWMGARRK